jgi:hypothetical protein
MKTSRGIPIDLFRRLLLRAIVIEAEVSEARATLFVSFFRSVEEFTKKPLRRRRYLSASGKQLSVLSPTEFGNAEMFRRRLAQLEYPYEKLLRIIETHPLPETPRRCHSCGSKLLLPQENQFTV